MFWIKHCAVDDDYHSDFRCGSYWCDQRRPVSWSLWSQATNSRRVLCWQGRKLSCLSISISSILQVQSGASGWEKGFGNFFLKVPIAYLGSTAAVVKPNSLWNSQKTFYKTFFTTCCPKLYFLSVPRWLVCSAHSCGPIQPRRCQMYPCAIRSLRQWHIKRVQHRHPHGWLIQRDMRLGRTGWPQECPRRLNCLLLRQSRQLLDSGHGLWVLHSCLFLRRRSVGNEVWVGVDPDQGAESHGWYSKHEVTLQCTPDIWSNRLCGQYSCGPKWGPI